MTAHHADVQPILLSADMDHRPARLNKSWLADVVTFFFVCHRMFNDTHELFVATASPNRGVEIMFLQ